MGIKEQAAKLVALKLAEVRGLDTNGPFGAEGMFGARLKPKAPRQTTEQRLALYGNPAMPALQKFLAVNAKYAVTPWDVVYGCDAIAAKLRANLGKIGLNGGSGAYYPRNQELTKWATSDGGELNAKLLDIVLDYCDADSNGQSWLLVDAMDGSVDRYLVHKRVGQAGYEQGKLAGDWA